MGKHILFDEQKHLYKLFKELDTICSENDIPYYLAGGSAIGAVRHGGFIPWDDDMDIMMFRKDWEKLLALPQEKFPQNRVICAQEYDREFHNSFGRYADTSTTAIHRNQIVQDDVAGAVIDILVMDPVPTERYDQYLKDLMLYADLVNDALVYSARWGINTYRYLFYSYLRALFGREWVLSKLEKKMFSYPENKEDTYAMRWGGIPFKFQGDMFAGKEIRKEPFEDIEGQVPARLSDYLVWHYGDNWMYIPPHGEREGHDAVFDMRVPYDVIRDDYKKFIDIEKLKRTYTHRKRAILLNNKSKRAAKKRSLIMSAEANGLFSAESLRKNETAIADAQEKGDFARLFNIFEPYLKKQLSREYIGREDYSGLERFIDPVVVPISPQYHALVLEVLFENGMFEKVSRLAEIYTSVNPDTAESFSPILADLKLFRHAMSLSDLDQKNEALDLLVQLHEAHPQCLEIMRRIVCLAGGMPNQTEIIEKFIALGKQTAPDDGVFIKYETDLRFDETNFEAIVQYLEAYTHTKNGFVLKDITQIIESQGNALIDYLVSADDAEYGQVRDIAFTCTTIVPTMETLKDQIFYSDIKRLKAKKEIFEDQDIVRFGYSLLVHALSKSDKEEAQNLLVAYWVKLGLDAESAKLRARYCMTDMYDLTALEALKKELEALQGAGGNELNSEQQLHGALLLARINYELVEYPSMMEALDSLSAALDSCALPEEGENFLRQDIKAFLRTQVYFQGVYSRDIHERHARELPGDRSDAVKMLCAKFGYSWSTMLKDVQNDDLVKYLSRATRMHIESSTQLESLDSMQASPELKESPDPEESKVLTLRREVEALCLKNDIQYFCYGRTALQGLNGENPGESDYYQKLIVPPEQYLRLVKLLSENAKKVKQQRAVDAFLVNKNYPAISCRYVDTSTTAFNLHQDKSYKHNGKYVEIIPLREEGRYSLSKWLFEAMELGWEDSQLPLRRNSRPKRMLRMMVVKVIASTIGKVRFQEWLLKKFSKFASESTQFGWAVKEPKKQKRWINEDPFSSIQILENGMHISRVVNPEGPVGPVAELAQPEHLVVSENVPYAALFEHYGAKKLDYNAFYRKQRTAAIRTLSYRSKSIQKNRAWEIVKRSGDRLNLQLLYAPRKALLSRLLSEKDYSRLAYVMSDHQEITERYLGNNLGFAVNKELFALQSKLYRLMGDNERAKKLKKLASDDLLSPIISSSQVEQITGVDYEA